jgi:pimeloyl-ACP methyl ester carboxylesterase
VHRSPGGSDSWLAIAEVGYRTISYDRRGFGRSSQPWNGYDYDTLANDLAAVNEQTGAQDITLMGFSMGGGEVARYMSRHAGKAVVQAALISSILPFRLKNSRGTDQAAFAATGSHYLNKGAPHGLFATDKHHVRVTDQRPPPGVDRSLNQRAVILPVSSDRMISTRRFNWRFWAVSLAATG